MSGGAKIRSVNSKCEYFWSDIWAHHLGVNRVADKQIRSGDVGKPGKVLLKSGHIETAEAIL
jgi:hypothetical protein